MPGYSASDCAPPEEYGERSRSGMLQATRAGTVRVRSARRTRSRTRDSTRSGLLWVNQAALGQLANFAMDLAPSKSRRRRSVTAWWAASLPGST